ncbi:PorP/SprF family type IX secretion system membrane protein [Flavobacterium granuli]|uniref:Type IX secretion system PorP/SprF family membrane protein n=1 Tax=Flavobacterium granuli TaxID=280093 RepID=A0A1M5PCJ6_9FLAO|nr:type IX secretion system membrane protein PorP/SprF [Flavobacterium granuli]PRZ26434.1 type IX secretion system PorP/SprF family membrane protein [Flavobacterium granuli]SHG99534.1 type IX secretion system membrane protein, PorP/SprF family [Flavobacterium granuli]
MKKFKLLIGIFVLISSISTVFAQQDPQYTQYMYSMNILNPAYAGSRGVTSIGLLGRTQWVGVDGAPQTATLSINGPVGKNVGLGFSVIHDEIGPVKEDNLYADFSYTLNFSGEDKFAFGIKAGATFLNVREFTTVDQDPLNVPVSLVAPNFGVGVMYYNDRFYAGLSVPNFIESRYLDTKNGISSSASEKTHYFLTSGYVFDLDENLKLKPSTMLKAAPGAPLSVDLSLNLLIQEKVELGLSHRLDDSISGMVGFQVSQDLRIGYAYDYTTTNFGVFNSGSHEIMILFDLNKKKIKSPRFF